MQLQRFHTASHTSRCASAGSRRPGGGCDVLLRARQAWTTPGARRHLVLHTDSAVGGWDSLLRKTWEPPAPRAESQGESSAGMLAASVGLVRHPALSPQRVEDIKKTRPRIASALGQQDQGCCPLLPQLEGKIRQACLSTTSA